MSPVESVIVVLLLLMVVPDLCRQLGRPGLVYPAFVLVGIVLGEYARTATLVLLEEAGTFGFILLLFLIGLEIELPSRRQAGQAFARSASWFAVQAPLVALAGYAAGLPPLGIAVVAVALTGCSVGMAYPAWAAAGGGAWPGPARQTCLLLMVALEIQTILALAAAEGFYVHGFGPVALARVGGVLLAVTVVALMANRLARGLGFLVDLTHRWKAHLIVLLVLGVAAVAERLGLSAAKAAFFLGLFINRATHEGLHLEARLEPIAERLLVPVFFVALGSRIEAAAMVSPASGLALATALGLLLLRRLLQQPVLGLANAGGARPWLLVSPNLSMAAIAVGLLQKTPGIAPGTITFVLLTGLFLSVLAVLLLPPSRPSGNILEDDRTAPPPDLTAGPPAEAAGGSAPRRDS